MVLNENVYAQVRQAVLDKLGVNVWGNVVHIEI